MKKRAPSRGETVDARAPRVGVRFPAVMIREDGEEVGVTIVDVSSGGFRLELPQAPTRGELVRLRVDKSGLIDAQIRWIDGTEAGGVFLSPVEHAEW